MNKKLKSNNPLRRINEIDDRFEAIHRRMSSISIDYFPRWRSVARMRTSSVDPPIVLNRQLSAPDGGLHLIRLDAIRVINERVAAVEHRKVVAGVFR